MGGGLEKQTATARSSRASLYRDHMSRGTPLTNHFPSTHRTWLETQIGVGAAARDLGAFSPMCVPTKSGQVQRYVLVVRAKASSALAANVTPSSAHGKRACFTAARTFGFAPAMMMGIPARSVWVGSHCESESTAHSATSAPKRSRRPRGLDRVEMGVGD